MAENHDLVEVALHILQASTSNDLEVFFITAWSVWYSRNQSVHEGQYLPSSQTWGYAKSMLEDYIGAMTACFLKQQALNVGWAAPLPGVCKINVDGATSESGLLSSMGVIIRDCMGDVVAARGRLLPALYSVEVIEAYAIEEGIKLACEVQLSRLIIESDSAIAVQVLNSRSFGADFGIILQGALTMLSSFKSWSVKHLKREYNRAAHNLAQITRSIETSQTWFGCSPPIIQNVLLIDRSKC